jgi:hypothetical protein
MTTLQWADDAIAEVGSADQLRALVATVLSTQKEPAPFLIELVLDSGDVAHLGIGEQRTVVSVQRSGHMPPFPISKASDGQPADEVISFDYAGSDTEFLYRNTVPFEDGVEAFIYFFASGGGLWPGIQWE